MQPRILDAFCGAGGAGMGYHRAGFDVVGVDIAPQKNYPFEFHQCDALEFIREHGAEFDVIHASPPCQAYIKGLGAMNRNRPSTHLKLIEPTRSALLKVGVPWVIENVPGAPLFTSVRLCGSSFGLKVRRHRLFESSILIWEPRCQHREQGRVVGVYGNKGSWALRPHEHGGSFHRAESVEEASEAMGIDWMTWRELTQAIPPAYTEYLGIQLLSALLARAA